MTNSDNDSLLGHIARRHTQGLEDVATDALAFIVSRSKSARKSLSEFLGDDEGPLPIAEVGTQEFLAASWAYPDMALWGSEKELSGFVESKFWAGLTHNQPVTYWETLPDDRRTVLLFLAPQSSVDAGWLWDELVRRLNEAGHELGQTRKDSKGRTAASTKVPRRLMLTSWSVLLGTLAKAAKQDGDAQAVFEIAELQGLAANAVEGIRDTSNDRFKQLLADAVKQATASGWANADGLTVGQGTGYYGRYLRLGGSHAWLGVVDEAVKQMPDKPLWLSFYQSEFSDHSLDELRSRLDSRVEQLLGALSWMGITVPIPLPNGADINTTRDAIVEQLVGIAELIDPNGPTCR